MTAEEAARRDVEGLLKRIAYLTERSDRAEARAVELKAIGDEYVKQTDAHVDDLLAKLERAEAERDRWYEMARNLHGPACYRYVEAYQKAEAERDEALRVAQEEITRRESAVYVCNERLKADVARLRRSAEYLVRLSCVVDSRRQSLRDPVIRKAIVGLEEALAATVGRDR